MSTVWYGDWFDYVLDWERDLKTQTEVDIFCSAFEDLKKVSRRFDVCVANHFDVRRLKRYSGGVS